MKNILITTLILCSTIIKGQNTLQVEIINLNNNKGQVIIELLDEQENSIKDITMTIKNNKCVASFKDLKSGKYAIRYFHDENSNKELDTNWIGMPKEGIGFSNNASGKFGPADFEEWLFDVKGDTKIELSIIYL